MQVGELTGPVEVGPIAHGGHCVARVDGRVVFVRHALPGERVRLSVTEVTKRFARADTAEVLDASPHRVAAPCPVAGRCGGCDLQHVEPSFQLEWKRRVLAEQLQRLAGIDWDGVVEPVEPLLGSRSRMRFVVGGEGRLGLRAHRSHEVVPLPSEGCLLAHPLMPQHVRQTQERETQDVRTGQDVRETRDGRETQDLRKKRDGETHDGRKRRDVRETQDFRERRGVCEVRDVREMATDSLPVTPDERGSGQNRSLSDEPSEYLGVVSAEGGRLVAVGSAASEGVVTQRVGQRSFTVGVDGFWQSHPAAPEVLTAAVLDGVRPEPGERAFDLYCGVGVFAGSLVDAGCRVWGVEGGKAAIRHAKRNVPEASFFAGDVGRTLPRLPGRADLVVLDPPRTGAGRAVMTAIARRRPRAVAYVACDPAALARDLGIAIELGYTASSIRAFDLFGMTQHLEAVAILHAS
ncbi:MAG: TRAM domain-containing protein [Micropruina sp.]